MIFQILLNEKVRAVLKHRSWPLRRLTSKWRKLPDFIIIGAKKCGTSFLHRTICSHPQVEPSFRKEVQYFTYNFNKSESWYRAHFPLEVQNSILNRNRKNQRVAGEATPYYLYHPHAPARMRKQLPNIKLILILRNPSDRAYSHFCHERRKGREILSFDAALRAEESRLAEEERFLSEEGEVRSRVHENSSYLRMGIYVDQLRKWLKYYPIEQFLIIDNSDLAKRTAFTLNKVSNFLGIKESQMSLRKDSDQRSAYEPMSEEMRRFLNDFFEPFNKQLYSLLNRDFHWER